MRVREIGRAGARAPLLVVLDGPEYVRRAFLLRLLHRLVDQREAPPHRVALVVPDDRLETYSASTPYARALVAALDDLAGRQVRRVGLGSSLGGLALLHAHRLEPRSFAGLFLQSGSFFRRRTDPQERGFRRFARVARFVGTVLRGEPGRPIPVTITCGLDEENLENNRAVAAALTEQGYDVELHESPGGHDWPLWRRQLKARLPGLLERAWST